MENAKRLAEAIIDNYWDWRESCSGRAYADCHFCCGSASEPCDIEHDSECPVLLAKKVFWEEE